VHAIRPFERREGLCGLVGLFTHDGRELVESSLRKATEMLKHRGPDDEGAFIETLEQSTLAIGHTRLSIIDLSGGGHQPMTTADGRFTIVFNGEVLNFVEVRQELEQLGIFFETDSDTEVLLSAWRYWGDKVLRKLVGMFAFAVYDREYMSLSLVRDAFGIKPLFFHSNGRDFYFSSEVPALLALLPDSPPLNLQQCYDYLVWGHYDRNTATFFEGIFQLAPGHIMTVDMNSGLVAQPRRWWWPSIAENTDISFEDAALKLRALFLEGVKLNLRSDVCFGVSLSGGIDSSAVACAIRRLEPDIPIHTFSYIARGSAVDEELWVDKVNEHIKASPHKVYAASNELIADLDDMVKSQGEPFGGTSIYAQYRVYQEMRNCGRVVSLDGQGADELLAGYDGYPDAYLRSLWEKRHPVRALLFLIRWSRWPRRGWKHALLVFGWTMTPRRLRTLARRLVGSNPAPGWLDSRWLRKNKIRLEYPLQPPLSSEGKGRRLVEELRSSLTERGLPALLRHGDRNSMRWSVEARVPFLTIDLAEFILGLPESFLVSADGQTKSIFRAAMRGIVPDEIIDRRDKIGFETPESSWLRDQKKILEEIRQPLEGIAFLKSAKVLDHLRKSVSGERRWGPRDWGLINFLIWHRNLSDG
jgi:asparagine synthase (glutamine-hydrolysing)